MRSLGYAVRLVALASAVGASAGQAQGIGLGFTDLGGVVGLGGLGGASLAFGGRFEKVIKPLPDLGDGLLGIQVGADWWSWNYDYFQGNSSSVSYIPIGVTANYHFKMENKKFDPFVGAGLGFYIVSEPSGYTGAGYNSGLYFIGVIGMRYFLNDNMAFYADAGAGAGSLHVGLSWKLGGGS